MILLKPVQPNFIKVLLIASIGTFSLNAVADHHGGAKQKASKAATVAKDIEATDSAAEVEQDLSADELRIKMDDEKAKAQMQEMMAKDPNKTSEAK